MLIVLLAIGLVLVMLFGVAVIASAVIGDVHPLFALLGVVVIGLVVYYIRAR
jgi:hypothetical protein